MPTQDLTFLNPVGTNGPVGINNIFPALQFFPQENGGIYWEEREVLGEQWQVQNATYNISSNQWLLVDPSKPARAFVSSGTLGEIDFRLSPAGMQPCAFATIWSITDGGVASLSLSVTSLPVTVDLSLLGIYNVQAPKYGAVPNDSTVAAANTAAIQLAVTDAVNLGGTVFFPPGTFWVNPGINITGQTRFFAMGAASAATKLFVPVASGGGNLFTIQTTGSSAGQVAISTMTFQYDVPLTGAAFLINGAQDASFNNLFFIECPNAINCFNGLQTLVNNCTMTHATQMNCQSIVISGTGNPQTNSFAVTNCLLRSGVKGNFALNNTAIVIGQISEGVFQNVLCSDYDNQCVIISPENGGAGSSFVYFDTCTFIAIGTAVTLSPQGNQTVQDIKFSNTLIRHSKWHGAPFDNNPGVYLTVPSNNSQLSAILFDNCTIDEFGGAGIEFNGGQHLKVLGGVISGNALGGSGILANISITGPCSEIEIADVNCAGATGYQPGTAPWGISVDGAPNNVFIAHCNVRGVKNFNTNMTGGFAFGTVGSNLQIYDCYGYNELGIIVAVTPTATFPVGSQFGSAQVGAFAGANTVYYGPVELTVVGTTHVNRNGHNTTATGGTWVLRAGNQDLITLVGTPSAVTAIGQ